MTKPNNNVLFSRCVQVYQIMAREGTHRNGLWLEANDFDLGLLASYNDEVVIFQGTLKDIAKELGLTTSAVTNILNAMRACGWLTTPKRGMYILVHRPNDDDFEQFKVRISAPVDDHELKYGTSQAWFAHEIAKLHARIERLEQRVWEIESDNI